MQEGFLLQATRTVKVKIDAAKIHPERSGVDSTWVAGRNALSAPPRPPGPR